MKKTRAHINRFLVLTVAIIALIGIVFARGVRQNGPGWFDGLLGKWNEVVELPPKMNILFVGVDKRLNWEAEHCDAIHLLKIDLDGERIEIVNIPRGTPARVKMPAGWTPKKELVDAVVEEWEGVKGGSMEGKEREGEDKINVAPELTPEEIAVRAWGMEQYISNLCFYESFGVFVKEVEKISGERINYTARIGFSEAEGILRVLKFNPATTLQFLRHRQSFPLGDVQRSFNQAVFIGDLLSGRISDIAKLPAVLQYAMFKIVETDMPPEIAHTLFKRIADSKIAGDRTRVTHKTMPAPIGKTEAIHINADDVQAEVGKLYGALSRLLPGFTMKDTEATVDGYIRNSYREALAAWIEGDEVKARKIMETIVASELWHQVEDDGERVRFMAEGAKIWSALEFNRTHSRDIALELPLRIIGYLSLENNGEVFANELWTFLNRLLVNE